MNSGMRIAANRILAGALAASVSLVFFFMAYENMQKRIEIDTFESAIEVNEDPGARQRFEWMKYHDPATGEIPRGIRAKELIVASRIPSHEAELLKLSKSGKTEGGLVAEWARRGPYNIGGRTRAFTMDATNPAVILAGGVSGGMWRSVDGGSTWSKTTVPNELHSVSCLIQDKRAGKTATWYYGTGELYGNSAAKSGASYRGDGMFKSTDNGATWSRLASTATNSPHTFDPPWDYIWNVAVDNSRNDSDIVYAATIGALMRSNNGGASWKIVLGTLANPNITPSGNIFGGRLTEVQVTPAGVVYAGLSSADVQLQTGVAAINRGIWRSPDGNTWTNITPAGWSTGDYKRIVLSYAPSNPNVVYALAETPGTNATGHSLWKYTFVSGNGSGAGGTWVDRSANIPNETGLSGNAKFDSQGSYDLVVAVKPDNENMVFIGGTNLYRSTDGWATNTNWKRIGGYASPSTYTQWTNHHCDIHSISFHPTNPNMMLNGNDGGIYFTFDATAEPVVWNPLNNGFFNTQFYTVAIDHGRSGNTNVMGGMQDNGTWFTNSTNQTTTWVRELTGDGSFCAIADGGSSSYISSQSGNLYRVVMNDAGDYGGSWTRIVPTGASGFIFVNPFALDPNNQFRMFLPAGNMLWRNNNLAGIPLNNNNSTTNLNWDSLSTTKNTNVTITAVAVSKTPANRVYYGTAGGRIYRLDNADVGQPTPTDIYTLKGFPTIGYVNCIAIDPTNGDKAIAVFTNYSVQSLFYTTDAGASWTPIGGNLEENPTTGAGGGPSTRWAAILPFGGTTTYFVGTSVGLYSTTTLNGTSTAWTKEGATIIGNLPVDMIDVRTLDGLVVVATHGGGMFSATLKPTLVEQVAGSQPLQFALLPNYPNPFNPSTTIRYAISERSAVRLRIFDVSGKEIATLVNQDQLAGTYEARWTGWDESGRSVASGVYYSRLESGSRVSTQKMILLK